MPDEDKNFGGALVLDFRKRWRHVKTIYYYDYQLSKARLSPCFHERCLPWFCFYFTEVKFLVV